MFDATLYQEVTENFIKTHTKFIVNSFKNVLEWKSEGKEEILDVGCGEGSTTIHILEKMVMENTKNYNILGIDLMDSMIDLAKKSFPNRENIQFKQADILDVNAWVGYKEHFHKVLSILCFMIVPNPKVWIKNIYNVLKPNGQIFFMLCLTNAMVKQQLYLSKQKKWETYQKKNAMCSEFFINENSTDWIIRHLEEGGFKHLIYNEIVFDTPLKNKEASYKFTKAFTLLNETIPEELKEEYLNELCENIEKEYSKNKEYSKISYLIISGRK
nr:juvenile hormone acid O-methyltransferase-like [Onthophagus taurus]